MTAYLTGIEQVDTVAGVSAGRAASAEDYDECGALWVAVRTMHRRCVLNAALGEPTRSRKRSTNATVIRAATT